MSNDMVGLLSLAVGVVSLILQLKVGQSRCRNRQRERFRSFKFLGIELTAYDRDDDSRS
jgi:hypothetical protein